MQGKHLYEYAVIRVLPKVEREEFVNVGIILFSKQAKFIKMRYQLDKNKFCCFMNELDWNLIQSTLQTFERIVSGNPEGGAISKFEIAERFRWLTAERSACIQTSRPHSGFSENLSQTVDKLFEELVL